jgi:nitrate reductase (cytochrome), electron transfer subunit
MTRMTLLASLALAVPLGCAPVARAPQAGPAAAEAPRAAPAGAPAQEPSTGTPDTALGLSKTSVFDVPAPPAYRSEDSTPGEKTPPPPRSFAGWPPVVPHGVSDFLPITRDANACIDCHGVKEKKTGEATPIPASHYTDLRRAPSRTGRQLAGTRQICTVCHVARTDAPPLVGNAFAR